MLHSKSITLSVEKLWSIMEYYGVFEGLSFCAKISRQLISLFEALQGGHQHPPHHSRVIYLPRRLPPAPTKSTVHRSSGEFPLFFYLVFSKIIF